MSLLGVTDTGPGREDKHAAYVSWLECGGRVLRCLKLTPGSGLDDLARCDGIVLTGGGDVDPRLYGGRVNHPRLSGVDRRRDDFELKLLEGAISEGKPVLGICRGLQIANVYFQGSLIADLAEAGHPGHGGGTRSGTSHQVSVSQGTLLERATSCLKGEVHSSHHQAVARVGDGLKVSAQSEDGIVEALELEARAGRGAYFLLVQWHPERMRGTSNPFEGGVLKSFLDSLQPQQ